MKTSTKFIAGGTSIEISSVIAGVLSDSPFNGATLFTFVGLALGLFGVHLFLEERTSK